MAKPQSGISLQDPTESGTCPMPPPPNNHQRPLPPPAPDIQWFTSPAIIIIVITKAMKTREYRVHPSAGRIRMPVCRLRGTEEDPRPYSAVDREHRALHHPETVAADISHQSLPARTARLRRAITRSEISSPGYGETRTRMRAPLVYGISRSQHAHWGRSRPALSLLPRPCRHRHFPLAGRAPSSISIGRGPRIQPHSATSIRSLRRVGRIGSTTSTTLLAQPIGMTRAISSTSTRISTTWTAF